MKKVAYFLMILGLCLFSIATADIIGIIMSMIETLFSINLNASYFDSFVFRSTLLVFGGISLLIGGLMLNKYNKENK